MIIEVHEGTTIYASLSESDGLVPPVVLALDRFSWHAPAYLSPEQARRVGRTLISLADAAEEMRLPEPEKPPGVQIHIHRPSGPQEEPRP